MNSADSMVAGFFPDFLTRWAHRFRYWIHALLYPASWAALYLSGKLSSFDSLFGSIVSTGPSPIENLGMEFIILIQLAVARIVPPVQVEYYVHDWITWTLFLFAVFLLPQILFWAFRTERRTLLMGILIVLTIGIPLLHIHRLYCASSWKRVTTLASTTMPASELIRLCGSPVYYRSDTYGSEPCRTGFYTDGRQYKQVFFLPNDTAQISGTGGLWLD